VEVEAPKGIWLTTTTATKKKEENNNNKKENKEIGHNF